jgi:hypothetical protein
VSIGVPARPDGTTLLVEFQETLPQCKPPLRQTPNDKANLCAYLLSELLPWVVVHDATREPARDTTTYFCCAFPKIIARALAMQMLAMTRSRSNRSQPLPVLRC